MEGKYLKQYNENSRLLDKALVERNLKAGFVYASKTLLIFGDSRYEDLFKTYRQMIQLMNHAKKRRIRRDAKKVAGEIITALDRLIQSNQHLKNNLEEFENN